MIPQAGHALRLARFERNVRLPRTHLIRANLRRPLQFVWRCARSGRSPALSADGRAAGLLQIWHYYRHYARKDGWIIRSLVRRTTHSSRRSLTLGIGNHPFLHRHGSARDVRRYASEVVRSVPPAHSCRDRSLASGTYPEVFDVFDLLIPPSVYWYCVTTHGDPTSLTVLDAYVVVCNTSFPH